MSNKVLEIYSGGEVIQSVEVHDGLQQEELPRFITEVYAQTMKPGQTLVEWLEAYEKSVANQVAMKKGSGVKMVKAKVEKSAEPAKAS